tara:strand:- start:96 stop:290 length:195 start_codon:yes stop_codon:yes gene_type:complete
MKKPPPEYFFPHRPVSIKRPKSYDFLVQMLCAAVAILAMIGMITEKGCNNEKNMEQDKTMDSKT